MNIALLSAFYPYRGGIAQFGAQLYRALEKEDNPNAFTFSRQYPNVLFPGTSQYVTEDDNVDEIPALQILDSLNPISYKKTAKAIMQSNPSVLISQYWMPFFGPSMGGVHKRLKHLKRISILHNVIPHEKRFFDSWANKQFLRHNEGFVVLSDAVQSDLLSLMPDAKYLRIDHPVYDQFGESMDRDSALKRLGLPDSHKYILFFGFIRDYKGLDVLIKAMNEIDEDTHLIVAGEVYGSFDKYDQLIKENNLSKRIHLFTKYISDEEVTQFFSAAEACVLPYKSATQSGITAISTHFDLPVIATDVGGLKEIINHNETGIIVPNSEPTLIAEAVNRYMQEGQKELMSQKISSQKSDNSWDNFAKKIIEFAATV